MGHEQESHLAGTWGGRSGRQKTELKRGCGQSWKGHEGLKAGSNFHYWTMNEQPFKDISRVAP